MTAGCARSAMFYAIKTTCSWQALALLVIATPSMTTLFRYLKLVVPGTYLKTPSVCAVDAIAPRVISQKAS